MSHGTELGSAQAPARGAAGFWAAVREAIRGSEQDYTEGSLRRAILLLAVPMVLELGLESVFAVVDVFYVARLGAEAVAAVGLTEALLTILYSVATGLSMATTAMVARRIGEKDPEAAAVAAAQSLWLGVGISALSGVTALAAPRLLGLMGGTPAVIAVGWGYTAVMLATSASIFLLFLINAVFRGAGDAAIAMRSLWLANLINLVLDPCFIFGLGPFPKMGVTGAAVATAIGRGTGVLYQWSVLARGRGRIRLGREQLRLEPKVLWRLLRVSLTGMLQFLIGTASWLGLVRIIALYGSAVVAGYTIAVRIIVFALLPSWGMSNAAATLVGQNLGAGKPERAERSAWATGFYNMLFLGAVGAVFVALAGPLVRLFATEAAVVAAGVQCLRVVSYGYPFYAYGMVLTQAFNGAGDTVTPTAINFFCYWLLEIPLAWLLAMACGLGPAGVFWAIAIAESALAVAGAVVFRRGKWKGQRI